MGRKKGGEMSLKYAHEGYEYQDLLSAYYILREIINRNNCQFYIDIKEINEDKFDDLTINTDNKIIKNQTAQHKMYIQIIKDVRKLSGETAIADRESLNSIIARKDEIQAFADGLKVVIDRLIIRARLDKTNLGQLQKLVDLYKKQMGLLEKVTELDVNLVIPIKPTYTSNDDEFDWVPAWVSRGRAKMAKLLKAKGVDEDLNLLDIKVPPVIED